MFDFVRNHTRLVLGFMLLLIIPSFVFFGVEGYRKSDEGGTQVVAKVDGQPIMRGEWDAAHQRTLERARAQMPGVDPRAFDSPQLRGQTLDALVRERVLFAAAQQLRLTPGDARLQRLFATEPQFAPLRNPDGSVNRDLLAAQGMTSDGFAARLRQEIASQQVVGGVVRSAWAPTAIVDAAAAPLLQRREVQLQRFEPAAYQARIDPTEAEIEAAYRAAAASYMASEQATIEYVVLDLAALQQATAPSEAELRRFYDSNLARFTGAEERRASHILINADKDLPAAERAKAKARAQALLDGLRKSPATFAEVARRESQDTGSAAQGGDLGYFGRGAMVKAFEDSAFALEPGALSDLVETEYGYHIIQLTDRKGGQARAFDAVRAEIDAELRRANALKRWPELAEQFTNTVYEQSDSLQPVVDKLKLEKKTATVRRQPAAGAAGPLASQRLLDAVFGNEAVVGKRNTDAVEVGPNQLVSARVVQHQPARALPLADVRPRVRERLVAERAAAAAIADGQARLAALRAGGDAAKPAEAAWSAPLAVSRRDAQGLPPALVDAALRADPKALPTVTGVALGDGGYALLRVRAILPREPLPGGEEALRAQYAQAWGAAEAEAYVAALRRRFKVEVKPAAAAAAEADAAASAPAGPGAR